MRQTDRRTAESLLNSVREVEDPVKNAATIFDRHVGTEEE